MPYLRLSGPEPPWRAVLNNGMGGPIAHQDAFALLWLNLSAARPPDGAFIGRPPERPISLLIHQPVDRRDAKVN